MTRSIMLTVAIAILWAGRGSWAGDLTLTKDAKPAATIVIAAAPTRSAVIAAIELRDHVKKISGAELPIVADNANVQGSRIIVGESAATLKLGLKNEDFKNQEYMIGMRGGDLVLMGHDAAEPFLFFRGATKSCEGRFGKARAFDGAHDFIASQPIGLDNAQGSMEAWIRPDEGWEGRGSIVRFDDGVSSPWSFQGLTCDKGRLSYDVMRSEKGKPNTGGSIQSEKLSPGWHHALATWDAARNRREFFVDGKSVGVTNYDLTLCAKALLTVGAVSYGRESDWFKGALDEIRVSKTVRTPDGWNAAPPSADAATLALFHFDEETGRPNLLRSDFSLLTLPDNFDAFPKPYDEDHGSSDAVGEFLQRDCGVRWYAPGELGTVYPTRSTLSARVKELRRAPAFVCRMTTRIWGITNGLNAVLNNASQLECRLWEMRMKFGGRNITANHGLYGYYDRFWQKNTNNPNVFECARPDFFAKGYEGLPPQLCLTSTGLVAQLARDAGEFFATGRNPGIYATHEWLSVEPMDNDAYCRCPECMKWYKKGDQPGTRDPLVPFMSGRYSDYVFQFANAVQKEVGKTCPSGHVSVLAYGAHSLPPSFPLDPRIYIGPCLCSREWISPVDPKDYATWVAQELKNPDSQVTIYKAWAEERKTSGRLLSLWLYLCYPEAWGDGYGFHAFPGYHAHALVNQLRMFAADGVSGVFTCGIAEQLDTYVLLKFLDNPGQDLDALLDEFFTRYYGAAGEPLKRIYTLIEKTYADHANYPPGFFTKQSSGIASQDEEVAWRYLGAKERMDQMAGWMEQARAAKLSDVERRRVDIFDKGPWQYMVEGRRMWLPKEKHVDDVGALKKAGPPSAQAPSVPDAAGDLAKVDWAKAGRFAMTRTHEGYPADRQIAVEIAHDEKWLYLRLSDPVARDKVKPSGEYFMDDRWEIFMAAQCGAAVYIQFGIKPDGRFVCNAYNPNCIVIESGAKVKCRLDDKGWVTELAAPLSLVWPAPQLAGNTLYLNLYRPASAGQTTLAWSPNFAGGGYNTTIRLGAITLDK